MDTSQFLKGSAKVTLKLAFFTRALPHPPHMPGQGTSVKPRQPQMPRKPEEIPWQRNPHTTLGTPRTRTPPHSSVSPSTKMESLDAISSRLRAIPDWTVARCIADSTPHYKKYKDASKVVDDVKGGATLPTKEQIDGYTTGTQRSRRHAGYASISRRFGWRR